MGGATAELLVQCCCFLWVCLPRHWCHFLIKKLELELVLELEGIEVECLGLE